MARGSRDAPDPWGPELMPHPYEQVPEEGRPVREPLTGRCPGGQTFRGVVVVQDAVGVAEALDRLVEAVRTVVLLGVLGVPGRFEEFPGLFLEAAPFLVHRPAAPSSGAVWKRPWRRRRSTAITAWRRPSS
ncbi:hypothetical protein ABZS86_03300 [Streptomyces sp. NPDC005355]|uniref:hypothetical protein n=1 Tax=Streptomyces sp. NPDC005355 TaxID=3157038 RepID=UPI0033A5C919